jgi:hypothetical protein
LTTSAFAAAAVSSTDVSAASGSTGAGTATSVRVNASDGSYADETDVASPDHEFSWFGKASAMGVAISLTGAAGPEPSSHELKKAR